MDHTTKTAFARFAFPKVDPARAARAAEAMAKLHERQAAAFKLWSEAGRSAAEVRTADAADILDMVAPSAPGEAWVAPETTGSRSGRHPHAELGGDIAGNVMRTIQEALAKAGVDPDRDGRSGATPAPAGLPEGHASRPAPSPARPGPGTTRSTYRAATPARRCPSW